MFPFVYNIKTNDKVKIFVIFVLFVSSTSKNDHFAFSVITFIIALFENVKNS